MNFADIYNQIIHALSQNEFFQGGIILAVLTWVGYQLKSIPTFLMNKLRYYATYTIHFDDSSDFYRVFVEWLHENYPQKFRNVEVKFSCDYVNGEPTSISASINEPSDIKLRKLQFTDANVIFYGGRWLWISKDRKEINGLKDVRSLFYNNYSISGMFAKSAIDSLCAEILRLKQSEREDKNIMLFTNDYEYWQGRRLEIVKGLEHIFFVDKNKYLDDINEFLAQKDLYKSKGINYKRSYLLYGRGGTGKTSIAIATAQKLKYNLYMLNVASLVSDSQLLKLGARIEPRSVVLLEDIDCLFEEREVKTENINFSTMLNFLDGLNAPTDCIIIMTTNKPEVLDAAMTRKGRVDLALHIDYPKKAEIESFMSDFYNCKVQFGVGFHLNKPMSEVQDVCLRNVNVAHAVKEVEQLSQTSNGHLVHYATT